MAEKIKKTTRRMQINMVDEDVFDAMEAEAKRLTKQRGKLVSMARLTEMLWLSYKGATADAVAALIPQIVEMKPGTANPYLEEKMAELAAAMAILAKRKE